MLKNRKTSGQEGLKHFQFVFVKLIAARLARPSYYAIPATSLVFQDKLQKSVSLYQWGQNLEFD